MLLYILIHVTFLRKISCKQNNLCIFSCSSDRMQVPETEEEPQTPNLDDDGFESLDGNGSCDSNKEEQDISLTAEEYENVIKNGPVLNDSLENDLVMCKRCPKYKKNEIDLSTNRNKNHDKSDACNVCDTIVDKQISNDCIQINFNDRSIPHSSNNKSVDYKSNKFSKTG